MGWATGVSTERRPKSSGRVMDIPAKPGYAVVDETRHSTVGNDEFQAKLNEVSMGKVPNI